MDSELQFLEYSVPAADVAESLSWYQSLGFSELHTGNIRLYHYAVITEGDCCIGLHGESLEIPALSFVQPSLATHVRRLMAEETEFDFARIGIDEFHEAALGDPDGTLALLMEARSFSPPHDEDTATSFLGRAESLTLPCRVLEESIEFWQRFGFIAVASDVDGKAELHRPGLVIALTEGTRQAALNFRPSDIDNCLQRLKNLGVKARSIAEGYELIAPEGTRLRLLVD